MKLTSKSLVKGFVCVQLALLISFCFGSLVSNVWGKGWVIMSPDPQVTAPTGQGNINEAFNVTISVADVDLLFSWQIKIYYNNATVNCTRAWYTDTNVFAGRTVIGSVYAIEYDVTNGSMYFAWGQSLVGSDYVNVTDATPLCVIEFNGTSIGTSQLVFAEVGLRSVLFKAGGGTIPCEFVNGSLSIVPEFPTLILPMSLLIITSIAVALVKVIKPRKLRN